MRQLVHNTKDKDILKMLNCLILMMYKYDKHKEKSNTVIRLNYTLKPILLSNMEFLNLNT